MKKYLLILACAALCAGGCNYKRGSTQLQEILDTAESLGVDKEDFLYDSGFDDYNCGSYDPLVIKHYFPISGKNRVVLGLSHPHRHNYGNKYVGFEEPIPSAFVEGGIYAHGNSLLHSLNNGEVFNGILSKTENKNELIEAKGLKILSLEVNIDVERTFVGHN